MAPKKTTLNELGDMLAHVVKHMATKDDIADLATKKDLEKVNKTLDDHTRDLNIIKNDLKTNLDRRLQLDVRVDKIEKHLGLDKQIRA